MMIQRTGLKRLELLLEGRKAGILLGARQVGKSTLVQTALVGRRAEFLNFDIEFDRQRFLAAASLPPVDGWKSLGSPEILVLDEAQRLPEASRVVKGWYDIRLPVKLLLLGSSSLDWLDQAAESLTGRNREMVLPPLVFSEYLQSKAWFAPEHTPSVLCSAFAPSLRVALLESMSYGGYPEVATVANKVELLRELSSDYLWKDILQAGLVKTPDLIRRLLALLAHQAGAEVSVHELAVQLQMARPTVERYLDLLERTWVIFRLPAFSTNPRKEIAKSQKVFFWDTGIRNALLNAFSVDDRRPDLGSLWENWVMAEIAKLNLLAGSPAQLYFWRNRSQSEVDLIMKTGDTLRAYEIKWRPGRPINRAFQAQYGVAVECLDASNPFFSRVFDP